MLMKLVNPETMGALTAKDAGSDWLLTHAVGIASQPASLLVGNPFRMEVVEAMMRILENIWTAYMN